MAIHTQTVLDCADAHLVAGFWAAALGYEREDHSALVRQLLDNGVLPEAASTTVDGTLSFRTIAAIRHPDDPVHPFTGAGQGRRILFQVVPEPKTVKNRMHLDLTVGPDDRDAHVKRLEGLGATVLAHVEADGSNHVTMADPEGNEFDVQ
jgi:hypothetical protein